MTASAGRVPAGAPLTAISRWSRIYGLGSVYAKTLRDSRLALIIMGGLLGILLLSSGVAFGDAYATAASRDDLKRLVESLPPAMAGVYGNPFPVRIETLGGSIGWKTGASMGLVACLWSILALSGTLAGEARRGSLEFVAATPLGMRRIAVEKLAAHLTGMAIVLVVTAACAYLAGTFGKLPGDEIPVQAAVGFAAWIGVVALATGSIAFALAPLVGRGASAAIAGAVLLIGYFANGYQAAVPAFAPLANLTWFGWTAHHQPLAGQYDWPSLVPGAVVAVVLFAVGIVLFSRRDLGVTTRIPWPGLPEVALGLGGPAARSFGDRLPTAAWWGIGIGLMGFVFGAAALSFSGALDQLSPDTLAIFETIFPDIDLRSGSGAFLQLAFVTFGFILAGFAASTLVGSWASDENSGRLEMLLTMPMSRTRWAIAGGLGVFGAIALMTAIIVAGIGLGSVIAGGDVLTPILGSLVLGLYALALAGIGLAVGGLLTTGFAGEVVAAIVILTFLIDLLVPALGLPDWFRQLALTSHLGQPMIGVWDWPGMVGCVVIAAAGLGIGAWGMGRRDVTR
jgi:polyether ionophore transport system permease protein